MYSSSKMYIEYIDFEIVGYAAAAGTIKESSHDHHKPWAQTEVC